MSNSHMKIHNARQNNLKNLNLELPLGELIVLTGVSGSGKSTLAFDTVYAEGQRRYVETFSPYARQFLDRMDRPKVDKVEGIPPAIAIDQTNQVRTSRSTVGTMTELNDHLKLLFARVAKLYCRGCGEWVQRDTPEKIADHWRNLKGKNKPPYVLITFTVDVPNNFSAAEIKALLETQGYIRIHQETLQKLEVVQDRLRLSDENQGRMLEALELAFKAGRGRLKVYPLDKDRNIGVPKAYSSTLHCASCDIAYQDPLPSMFSFNSPVGACETCRGFGRTMGVDFSLVVPDERKTLAEGAVKPWQSPSYKECQDDLIRFSKRRKVPIHTPWNRLSTKHQQWVLQGEGDWDRDVWYGVQRFFDWLETKSYKMHIRVLLSKYRAYNKCQACGGARLKPDSLLWRVGEDRGLNLHEVMLLPIEKCLAFFEALQLPAPLDEATQLLLAEIRSRLKYLVEVGLAYLTLDRQSRTLSGGEVQRINLTTALGTSLVNTLFVLDEPSIGLHPRDMQRIVGVLHRLRDAGNSLLVVEHDPDVMLAADRIVDIGPGPGKQGGEVVFFGTPKQLLQSKKSLTADYLSGRKQVSERKPTSQPLLEQSFIVKGVAENNLKNIDVTFPLNRLVCVTGVSGSGKSTLVQDVLFNALSKYFGKPQDVAGAHQQIIGHECVSDVVMVDQSPIGKTTRSNPASYVGALDAIRKVFASLEESKSRGYKAGTFSFNSGNGRCPSCGGNGFEHVEMQFLSDVYLRCPDCDGRRYRREVLEVTYKNNSMADVLEMTVAEAVIFFEEHQDVARVLRPLIDVGLSYVQLGQPVPTLSGGEAQRLKLAGFLAKHSKAKRGKSDEHTLFLFDEPTTGLHFDDIAKLLNAFYQLIEQGHSLIVVEHNLDVINSADWLIDLGPEGGEAGGELIAQGTPKDVMKVKASYTGKALRTYQKQFGQALSTTQKTAAKKLKSKSNVIAIHHAREHNLKDVSLDIPREKMTVITGVSGSGKSTLAFDILFGEGQRRYLESLNAYARQFVQPSSRPEVDAVTGIPPTVAIEQRTSRGGHKSTVATMTELYHFMRLLFVKLGTQYCPDCDVPIEPQSLDVIVANILKRYRGKQVEVLAPLVIGRKGIYNDLAKWALKQGHEYLRVDGEYLSTVKWPKLDRYNEHDIELPVGELKVMPKSEAELREQLSLAVSHGKGVVYIAVDNEQEVFSTKRACSCCGKGFDELDPRQFSFNSKQGWCPSCYGTGLTLVDSVEDESDDASFSDSVSQEVCSCCEGQRLRPESLAVRFHDYAITEFTAFSVEEAGRFFNKLKLNKREASIARDVLTELQARLRFLNEVGLSYLTLNRAAPTLSGGEAQRIRLASQLGSSMRGVCYVLDEPTIGLHPRDNRMLLETLKNLEGKGNTVVVVEHDEETIRNADFVVDLGPGGGNRGGQIMAQGTLNQLMRNKNSLTGRMLANPLQHPLVEREVEPKGELQVLNAHLNNLQNIDVAIPLGQFICVTGVSGSGKSTLVRSVLYENLQRIIGDQRTKKGRAKKLKFIGCDEIQGWESVYRVLEVDQTPIGKTPRSCPATYIGFWDDVRKLFAATPEAQIRGYKPGRFSFNTSGGRCDACEGQGVKRIEMNFLPDVQVHCEACHGARFNQETLTIRYKEKSIGDLVKMSVDEAVEFFVAHPKIHKALQLLQDVGLGYLTLGQQSPTLSGGEAQRIKLVSELAKASSKIKEDKHTLYILDEPSVGLHMADVERLIHVLHRLVDAGHSVVLIEHNLDLIAEADTIIDMGPEGGDEGGKVVVQGNLKFVRQKRHKKSYTAQALNAFLGSA